MVAKAGEQVRSNGWSDCVQKNLLLYSIKSLVTKKKNYVKQLKENHVIYRKKLPTKFIFGWGGWEWWHKQTSYRAVGRGILCNY